MRGDVVCFTCLGYTSFWELRWETALF